MVTRHIRRFGKFLGGHWDNAVAKYGNARRAASRTKSEITYGFWPHEELAGSSFKRFSRHELDSFIAREKNEGRRFHVLGVEAPGVSHAELEESERHLNELVRTASKEHSESGSFKTSEATALESLLRDKLGVSHADEIILAAKHGLHVRLIESYSDAQVANNLDGTRELHFNPAVLPHDVDRLLSNHNLEKAAEKLHFYERHYGNIAKTRYKRIIERLSTIVKQERKKTRHAKVRCLVLMGGFNHPIAVIHRQRHPHTYVGDFLTEPTLTQLKQPGKSFRVQYRGSIAAGGHADENLLQKAILAHAVEQDLKHVQTTRRMDLRGYAAHCDELRSAALERISEVSDADFKAIAKTYHASDDISMHQLLERRFASK